MRKRNRQVGSAQISEFSAVLAVFFLMMLFPLINLISMSTAVATGYLAARNSAARAGDSVNYMEAIYAAEEGARAITDSGFGKFASLKPVGGFNGSGMNLYLTDTNIDTNVSITHGPNTPAVSAIDHEKYLYSYEAIVTYDVGPFLNLSSLPWVGDVAGLGKPVRMKFESSRNLEHFDGITIGGGGWISHGTSSMPGGNGSILGASTGGSTLSSGSAGAGGSALASAGGGGAGTYGVAAMPRRPWQVASYNGTTYYIPNVVSSFHIQLQGEVDYNTPVDVMETDLYSTTAAEVAQFQSNGGYHIAYLNTGAWQPGMPDSDLYPPEVIGKKPMKGWPEERWLDISQIEILRPIIRTKMELAKSKGFNAVDPDNMDGYTNTDEFGLTKADQVAFDLMVAEEAHKAGLAIFLKNAGGMMDELGSHFDGTVAEEAFKYREAGIYQPMRDQGKPVFLIEYRKPKKKEIAEANTRGFNVVQAKKQLKGATKMITPS